MLYWGSLEPADNLCKQFKLQSGPTERQSRIESFYFRSYLKILPSMQRAYKFDLSFYRSKSHSLTVLANMETITFLIVCIPIYT